MSVPQRERPLFLNKFDWKIYYRRVSCSNAGSDAAGWGGGGLTICVSHKLPGDALAAGLRTVLWVVRSECINNHLDAVTAEFGYKNQISLWGSGTARGGAGFFAGLSGSRSLICTCSGRFLSAIRV